MQEILTISFEENIKLDPCLFWAEPYGSDLIDSLDALGQMIPVLVHRDGDSLVLIAGYKRYQSLKKLLKKIKALRIDAPDPWDKGVAYLLSNQGQGLDPGRIIRALRYFKPLNKDMHSIYQILGIPERAREKHLYKAWLKLPPVWDELLIKNPQLLPNAHALSLLEPQDLEVLFPFLDGLAWSRNKARIFLELLDRTSSGKAGNIREVPGLLNLDKLLVKDLTPRDKMEAMLKVLYRAAYPEYYKLMDKAEKDINRLTSATGWSCIHTDHFESQDLEFRIRVRSPGELKVAADQLRKMADSELLSHWPVSP